MNEGIHLDLDTWIVPGQIRKANLCLGYLGEYNNNIEFRATYSEKQQAVHIVCSNELMICIVPGHLIIY